MSKKTTKQAKKSPSKSSAKRATGSGIAELKAKFDAVDRVQAVIEFELDGTVVAANENFLKTLGYTLDEIRGKHHRMFCEPSYVATAEYEGFWAKLRRGEFDAGIYRRLGKGGKEVWIQASYNPVFDASGKPYKVVKFATDVTEQKNRNAEFEGQLKAVDRAQARIEFTLDGIVTSANENFLRTLGYTLDEIKGRHHRMFCDPTYVASAEYEAFWAKLRRGELDAGAYRRLGKGGKEVWIQASYNPVFDAAGKPYKVVKFATDITGEKQAQAEIDMLVRAAAAGRLSERIDANRYHGSMKDLGLAMNRLMDGIVAPMRDAIRVLNALANGDLTTTMSDAYEGEFAQLRDATNASIQKLRDVVGRITEATSTVRQGSGDIADGNSNLSKRTQEQASALQETAASLEEMTATVKQNASNATQANQLATGARDSAEKGGQVVGAAVTAMTAITDSSKKVAEIISVIEQIAFQTNMLALNAAVEAARAGDQGRGFAVVASEVRNLAQRSAAAAKEIKSLIQDSQEKVEQGAKLVNRSGETLQEIVEAVKKVTDIIGEINSASEQQATGIDQINSAVAQMDKGTQENAAMVEEAAAAAESMSDQARSMADMMSFFKTGAHATAATTGGQRVKEETAPTPRKGLAGERSSAARPSKAGPSPSERGRNGFHAAASPSKESDTEWKEF